MKDETLEKWKETKNGKRKKRLSLIKPINPLRVDFLTEILNFIQFLEARRKSPADVFRNRS